VNEIRSAFPRPALRRNWLRPQFRTARFG
jgi:hypothetical protein